MTEIAEPKTYEWKLWKIALCAVAGILVLVGGIVSFTGPAEGETVEGPVPGATSTTRPANSLLPGTTPGPGGEVPDGNEPEVTYDEEGGISWSPALLKGGLSFFLAFALGYAFRMFLRIGLFFIGVWAASLFLLHSAGWVEVHWGVIDTAFESWASGLGEQFKSASSFITGSLPSAGMAGLGLFTGLRRK
jgi:uncharacterized membrane protein (Fun14 family)